MCFSQRHADILFGARDCQLVVRANIHKKNRQSRDDSNIAKNNLIDLTSAEGFKACPLSHTQRLLHEIWLVNECRPS